MLDKPSMEEQIRRFIVENFLFGDDQDLSLNASLVECGIMDSLGVMETVNYIEETFEIVVPDEELLPENLDSIQSISNFVIRKQKA